MFFKRTVTCGELRASDDKKKVVLNGWVHRIRNHGSIYFINLRDRYGITQVVVEDDASAKVRAVCSSLRNEFTIAVKGTVRKRPKTMINKDMPTGAIEVKARDIQILGKCNVLPFQIDEETSASENLRLQYRYLDLRSFGMQKRIALRHEVVKAMREYLSARDFFEIETPTLIRSTPEGARDFVVPSRLYPGKFYALPQSPQLMKQLLMVSGYDKYFQIARCYRDEDARGDRQLEFTQLDLEMSFVQRDDVLTLMEGLFNYVFKKTMNVKLPKKFRRIAYKDAMNLYGTDKPDLRFDLPLCEFKEAVMESSFDAMKNVIGDKGDAKAIVVKSRYAENMSRKVIESYGEVATSVGAKHVSERGKMFAYFKYSDGALQAGCAKYFTSLTDKIVSSLNLENGDLVMIVANKTWKGACSGGGVVRSELGKNLSLADPNKFEFCWIVDFPLFSYNEELGHWEAEHHMFSMPQDRFIDTLESNPGEVLGDLYDLVLNGYEVASGSIHIHDPELQKRIFRICAYSDESAKQAFGFLLKAFEYGAPPHGGIAPGVDRLVMIMSGQTSIKEVIAFPKNTFAVSPMDEAPTYLDEKQLKELSLIIDKKDQDK